MTFIYPLLQQYACCNPIPQCLFFLTSVLFCWSEILWAHRVLWCCACALWTYRYALMYSSGGEDFRTDFVLALLDELTVHVGYKWSGNKLLHNDNLLQNDFPWTRLLHHPVRAAIPVSAPIGAVCVVSRITPLHIDNGHSVYWESLVLAIPLIATAWVSTLELLQKRGLHVCWALT